MKLTKIGLLFIHLGQITSIPDQIRQKECLTIGKLRKLRTETIEFRTFSKSFLKFPKFLKMFPGGGGVTAKCKMFTRGNMKHSSNT